MLVSCWVFSAPTANQATAATAGSYSVSISYKVTNKQDKVGNPDSNYWDIYYKPDNGTGTETYKRINFKTNDWYSYMSSTGDKTLSTTVPGWPTKIYFEVNATLGDYVHYKINSWSCQGQTANSSAEELNSNVNEKSTTKTNGLTAPYASSITAISGDATVAVPTGGGTTTKSYSAGTVKDQYGVNWYQDASLSMTSTNGCTFSSGTLSVPASANRSNNYTVTINETCGNASNSKTVTISTFDYKVTFYDENGTTVLKSTQTIDYGGSATAPSDPTKSYDSSKHYAFDKWTGDSYQTIKTGSQTRSVKASYTGTNHTSVADAAVAATCTATGKTAGAHCSVCNYVITAQTTTNALGHASVTDAAVTATCTATGKTAGAHCSRCNAVLTAQNTVAALGHDWVEHEQAASDGGAGMKYFTCQRQGCSEASKYFGATYHADTNTYTADTSNEQSTLAAVEANTSTENMTAPAPAFNNFSVTFAGGQTYDYRDRGASLRIDYQSAFLANDGENGETTPQDLRFSGALTVPAGVSYLVGSQDDNVVTDFGFVYTQYRYISSINKLVIGGKTDVTGIDGKTYSISKMSLKSKNSARGNYDGSNWKGVTARTTNGVTKLTFNLVIAVRARNWNYYYAARPYITYKYHGVEYTVYDQGTTTTGNPVSYNSVAYVANQVVNDNSVHPIERNYFQTKIVDHLSELPGYTA